MIYLDNAATTRVLEKAFNAASLAMYTYYGNPSSLHDIGRNAANMVNNARVKISNFIGANPNEIIFTAGGTESDNLGLFGVAPYLKSIGRTTIITSLIEHHAVLNACKKLGQDGFKIIYMPVDQDGRVDIEELEKVMNSSKGTLGLVCIMAVNNEIGSIQLIDDIGDLCHEHGVLFMTDAVQALGHIPLNVDESHIDIMAMSGHKIGALKGIGALYVRDGVKLEPIIVGGGQERNIRSGTENVPGIVSMGMAVEILSETMQENIFRYEDLRFVFLSKLDEFGVEYIINAPDGVPNIISLTLPGCESEAMLLLLNERNIYVSAGSACTAGSLEPSHVLRALYLSDQDANCTIRISLGDNSIHEMIQVAEAISDCTKQLRAMSGNDGGIQK